MSTMPLTSDEKGVLADNLALVPMFVERDCRQFTGVPHVYSFEDALQDGTIGLAKATRTFDPAKGFAFSTYAGWLIRAEVRIGHRRAMGGNYRRTVAAGGFFRSPTSLQRTVNEDGATLLDLVADRPAVVELDDPRRQAMLEGLLAQLGPRDRIVVTNPSADAAALLGIKQASVHRRRARIYDRLREANHAPSRPLPEREQTDADRSR